MNLDDSNPIAQISKAIRSHRLLANQAKADLEAALPVLAATLSHNSGQSVRVAALIQSVWNGELSENLSCLDSKVAQAVLALIAVRAHLGGDADSLIAPLLNRKEQP